MSFGGDRLFGPGRPSGGNAEGEEYAVVSRYARMGLRGAGGGGESRGLWVGSSTLTSESGERVNPVKRWWRACSPVTRIAKIARIGSSMPLEAWSPRGI
ncbi:hypothetical protein AAFF_G00096960 [Aldrovandia affinis]|uniref:Uncharacterized protein n=1 Tax=Aldrovandia affinis TaxID=143900 RepID=A0AAD7RVJ4_9TELE|nr:hypothetical protein AAFF_G00096960 [Aldrovandia affinis]